MNSSLANIKKQKLILALVIANVASCCTSYSQITGSLNHGGYLVTNSRSDTQDGGFRYEYTSSTPQASLSYSHTATYSNGVGVTASMSHTINDVVTATSLDAQINISTATTGATGGAAAIEDDGDTIDFSVSQPVYYKLTASISGTGVAGAFLGRALLQSNITIVNMGVGNDQFTTPGTTSGILQPGHYTLYVESLCGRDRGYLAGNGSVDNNVVFHANLFAAPTATTSNVTNLGATSATLNGTVNPNGASTTAYVEYWAGTMMHQTKSITLNPTDSTMTQSVAVSLSGLVPNTTYQWQLVATNAAGSTTAQGPSFTTPNLSTLQFDAANYSVHENVGIATVVVNRAGGSSGAVSVYCALLGGNQDRPVDCTYHKGENGVLTWADGDTNPKLVDFDITDEHYRDIPYETFNLTLTDVTGSAQLGNPAKAVLAIFYDDPPQFQCTPEVIPNPNSSGSYRVMNILGKGAYNTQYTIQCSSGLSSNSFTNLVTVTTDSSGNFQYLDPIVTLQKFYRIIYPQASGSPNTNASDRSIRQAR